MPTTPNMNMTLPTVGVTVDPTWASNLNDALTNKVDLHDHSTGLGVPVPTAGININADLSFQSNDATNLRSVALNNNVSTLPSGDIRALYASSGNLYYNNNSGNAIRITNGTSLDTGSLALNVWQLQELAGNLTILAADTYVFINTNTAATRTITLPAASGVTAGRYFIIKDKTGQASTNNITITPAGSDTIDGVASSTTITSAYGSTTLVSDGVGGWLTNAALGGFIQLGGDLLGTGSSVTAPRVSGLTGISGLVTMANNTALNTRNAINSVNVNLAKMSGSDAVQLADTAYPTFLRGTDITLNAGTTSLTALANTSVAVTSTTSTAITAGTTLDIKAKGDVNVIKFDGSDDMYVGQDGYDIDVDGYRINIASQFNTLVGSSGSMRLACTDQMLVEGGDDILIGATTNLGLIGDTVTLTGKVYLPTKAVTSSPYTVDTTTNDYVIFVDSTGGAISINLPAASNGRKLIIQDVAGTANTNNITLVRNGSDTIQGVASNYVMDADFQGVTLIAYSGASWFIIGT